MQPIVYRAINLGLGVGGRINFYSIRWHEYGGAWFCRTNVGRRMFNLWHCRMNSVIDVYACFKVVFLDSLAFTASLSELVSLDCGM